MSKAFDIANNVIDIVARETDMSKGSIMSSTRNSEVVDARHMVIKILHSRGLYPSRIARIMGLSVRAVHYVITSFDDRMTGNKSLAMTYERIAKQLGNKLETDWK